MARNSTGFPTNHFALGSAIVPSNEWLLTMACWFTTTNASLDQTLMSRSHTSSSNSLHRLVIGTPTNSRVQGAARDTSGAQNATGSGGSVVSINVWHHAAMTTDASGGIEVFFNGVSQGSDSTNTLGAAVFDETTLTVLSRATDIQALSGSIMLAAMWSAVLDPGEIASLAAAYHPRMVRPQSLLGDWNLLYGAGDALDSTSNNNTMAEVGTITEVANGRIIMPSSPTIGHNIAAAPSGFQAAWASGSNVVLGAGVVS